ncbi:MAG TPA: ABC transporter ATP-binding protein [Candidatus Corynebacterium avicola]|uniref:ABC transporter ATP-binding protein n=1 Tax=Candidatus Corynebacterium avicola TaxID=2838527 RepID=A0A9D1RT01_9CORY|nr:ABC transporter ATP-binding protein [Candidatus Corynebacterium avicola]
MSHHTITLTDAELRFPGVRRGQQQRSAVVGPLTLELSTGVVGLVGRNGSGKTTLLGLLAGQLRASEGRVVHQIGNADRDAFDDPVVLETTSLTGVDIDYVPSWSVDSVLTVAAQRHPNWDMEEAHHLLEAFRVPLYGRYGSLSRGQRTAVSITVGLAAHTPVTLFDEPYVGLDAQARRHFYRALMESVELDPRLVVISTHHLPDLERIVDRVLVLEGGRLVHDIDAEDLEGRFYGLTGSTARVDAVLDQLGDGKTLSRQNMAGASRAVVDLGAGTSAESARAGVLADVVAEPLGLEDAVLQLTGGEPA